MAFEASSVRHAWSRELQLVLDPEFLQDPRASPTGGVSFERFFAADQAERSTCAPRSQHFRVFVATNAPTEGFKRAFPLEGIHGSSSRTRQPKTPAVVPAAEVEVRRQETRHSTMINWQYYPKSDAAPEIATKVIAVFDAVSAEIDSAIHTLESNSVLAALSAGLTAAGFTVESGKTAEGKVKVPVLFGRNGRLEKSFDADAFHRDSGFVLEVEAGRGVVNTVYASRLGPSHRSLRPSVRIDRWQSCPTERAG